MACHTPLSTSRYPKPKTQARLRAMGSSRKHPPRASALLHKAIGTVPLVSQPMARFPVIAS
jgi:hypothetical protein